MKQVGPFLVIGMFVAAALGEPAIARTIRNPVPTPTPAGAASPAVTPPAATPAPPAVGAVVALPLELKDPYTAYSLGSLPFMSGLAATYVGSTRMAWKPDDELMGAATRQYLADWGLLIGGISIMGLAGGLRNMAPQAYVLGSAAILAIPLSHVWLYGPYWGDQAVAFNRRQLARHGFPLEQPGATPLIIAP